MRIITPPLILLLILFPAITHSAEYQWHQATLSAQFTASVQSALFDDPAEPKPRRSRGNHDIALRLNGEWLSSQGWLAGARYELDQGGHNADELQRDEAYLYFSHHLGRIEIGEQDGPADRLAYHAPVIGLGQVRGDFSRYAGSMALLSPYDSSDAAKLIFLSAPINGLRYGISYAPHHKKSQDEPDPRDQTIQHDVIEFAARYKRPIGDWLWGLSGSYVYGNADPITEREDINSWSIGSEFKYRRFTFAGAHVVRGDSNRRTAGYDQHEINLGVAWRGKKSGVAISSADTDASSSRQRLYGVGGYKKLHNNLTLRADLLSIERWNSRNEANDGYVFLTELEFKI